MNFLIKYLQESIKYLLRSYPLIMKDIKLVEFLYGLNPMEMKAYKEKRFIEIFRRAYTKSDFYKNLYRNAGISIEDIQCVDDIKKLPIVTKDMIRCNRDDFLTVPKWKVFKSNTSGTTGTPLTVYEDMSTIRRFAAYLYTSRKQYGFIQGMPLVSLRGTLDRNVKAMKIHISNTLYLSSYNINDNTIKEYVNLINKHNPVAIEGYPSSLYALALVLRTNEMSLSIPYTFTSSETLHGYQRALIEEYLHTNIYDRYGMTEKTISLVESIDHAYYEEAPGFSIVETTEDGEVCTSLLNEAFPLIRYKSNDLLEVLSKENEFSGIRVGKIWGRNDDFLICKDKTRIKRIFIKDCKNILACQWIQKEEGKVLIKIVPDSLFSRNDELDVIRKTQERVGEYNMDIETEITSIENLIYTNRGKYKLIVNQI